MCDIIKTFVVVNKSTNMCAHYIVLLLLLVFCSCDIILDKNSTLENDLISSIISKFTDHNVFLHYDTTNQHRVYSIVATANIKGSIITHNYKLPILLRPTGYKFLHLILLKNYTQFGDYTERSIFSLTYVDVLFFVIDADVEKENNTDYFEYWPQNRLNKAGSMFVLSTWKSSLYSVCFYCGRKSGILQNIATLSDNATDNYNISVSLVDIHRNQFKNFNGFTFNVAYAVYKPFFWARIVKIGNASFVQMRGSEAQLIFTLHEKLNMKFYMEEFNDTKRNWNRLIEVVANDSFGFDFAMGGITITHQRMDMVDFTSPILTEPYTVLYSLYEDPWMSWKNLIIPFNFLVWSASFFTVVIVSGLFATAAKMANSKSDLYFLYFFRNCLRLLVEQPIPRISITTTSRVSTLWLMFLWLIFALIMTNSYKCKLTSFLIASSGDEFDSIDELVEKNYKYFVSSADAFVIQEYLENSADQKFLETLKHSKNDTDFCESIIQTSRQRVAVIDEETNFQFGIDKYCPHVTSSTIFSSLRLTRRELYPGSHAWPMEKNAPFRESVNHVIARLHAGGLFMYWSSQNNKLASPVHKSHQRTSASAMHRFTSASMAGPVLVWALGIVLATITLLLEIVEWKYIRPSGGFSLKRDL